MAIQRQASPLHPPVYAGTTQTKHLTGGGAAGNERLTAATGAVLIALLAVIGVTILRLHGFLLSVHLFVGIVLIAPVLLKLGSTGYRFIRYYTANPPYRRKGPPPAPLRMLAPLVIISTLVVLTTGVALLLIGPSSRGTLLPIHKVSFFIWLAATGLHVLGHMLELPDMLRADYGRSSGLGDRSTGRAGRVLAVAGALVAGVMLAILLVPEFGAWLHAAEHFHPDG
jgi:hypothetical protein